jgi:ankyrin repeat protein
MHVVRFIICLLFICTNIQNTYGMKRTHDMMLEQNVCGTIAHCQNANCENFSAALHGAVADNNVEAIRWLLYNGADMTSSDQQGYTALVRAVEKKDFTLIDSFLGWPVGKGDIVDYDYIFWTVMNCEKLALAQWLIEEKKVDIRCYSSGGRTFLHEVAQSGDLALTQWAIAQGADPNEQINEKFEEDEGNYKDTPLHVAARDGRLEVMQFLLEHGADTNKVNAQGQTALHEACRESGKNALKAVHLLVAHGVDITICDNNGDTALDSAIEAFDSTVAEGYQDIFSGYEKAILYLITKGCTCKSSYEDIFFISMSSYKLALAQWLIDEKKMDILSYSNQERTFLHEVAEKGNLQLVQLALKQGIDSNKQDSNGSTALHLAARNGNIEIMKLLLKHGADITKIDSEGLTAAWRAMFSSPFTITRHSDMKSLLAVIKLFIAYGVDITSCHDEGYSVLACVIEQIYEWADEGAQERTESIKVIKYLINQGCVTAGYLPEEFDSVIKKYSALKEEIEKQPASSTLKKALQDDCIFLVKKLLESGIVPTPEHLRDAKTNDASGSGRLLKAYIGLSGPELLISKTGISNKLALYDIPKEIINKIAYYTVV